MEPTPSMLRHPRQVTVPGGGPPRRRPLAERKRGERALARGRIAARTQTDLTPAQRAHDPLPPLRQSRTAVGRAARVLLVLVSAVAVHAGVVVVGLLIGGSETGRREITRQEVKIEVQERKVEPPPKPVEKEPEPERRAPPPPPKVAKAPPPPKAPEPPPVKGPPPRVVGLSLESTTEGGSGPAFAVGNTRGGETAERAAAPEKLAPAPAAPPGPAADPASKSNKAASSIPTAGVVRTNPKRKAEVKPVFPETLKSQGIEADVVLMLSIDATGKVTDVKIIREAPYPEFNEAARKAALEMEWEPATRDGVPIAMTISFTVRFRLEDTQ